MCLLHTHPADTAFDEDDIHDFYEHNSDGVGVMWAEGNVLYTRKFLPPNKDAAWKFYQEHILGKECVVHWRMKTHGKIDLENCHPYPIFGAGSKMPLSLMHNGVLATGNSKDTTKSDTWHYVVDFLRPLLENYPDMFTNPVMKKLIEEHIGYGNRFIMLNHKGEMSVINEKDFVTYKGAKLSNTYAWSSEKGGFATYRGGKSRGWGYYNEYDDYAPYSGFGQTGATVTRTPTVTTTGAPQKPVEEKEGPGLFFRLLRELKFYRAYYELTWLEVEESIEEAGTEMWKDFIEVIASDSLNDEQIVACVRDVYVTMIDTLYEDPEKVDDDDDDDVEEQTLTDGDLQRIRAEEERRAEQQRLNDEILALQTGQDGNLHPYY